MNLRYLTPPTALLIAASVSQAAVTFSSTIPVDTSWRAIGPVGDLTGQGINNVGLAWESSHVGWNTLIAFDDSDATGWKNAISVVHPNQPFIRYWVDGTETIGSSPAYFRKVFNIPGVPQSGSLDFNVDDDAKIYVNGNLVFSDSNSLANDFTGLNVTQYLNSGFNLIAVKAQDQQGAQSIQGQLNITYVPEPSALVLFAFGAASLSTRRRRGRVGTRFDTSYGWLPPESSRPVRSMLATLNLRVVSSEQLRNIRDDSDNMISRVSFPFSRNPHGQGQAERAPAGTRGLLFCAPCKVATWRFAITRSCLPTTAQSLAFDAGRHGPREIHPRQSPRPTGVR